MTLHLNRRNFLAGLGNSVAGSLLITSYPALAAAAAEHAAHVAAGTVSLELVTLSPAQAETVDAITARIIPSEGEGPGAHEARVVNFIDQAMSGVMQDQQAAFLSELADFEAALVASRSDSRRFAELSTTEQDACLLTQQDTDFFGWIQFLTCVGMFALPGYGGNADGLGWQLISFVDTHAFAPPFGYYDRDYPGYEAVAASFRQQGAK